MILALCVATLSLSASAAAQSLLANPMIPAIAKISGKPWPELDTPPPVVKEWLDLFNLGNSDNANLSISVRPTSSDGSGHCPDQDTTCAFSCTQCTRPSDITTVQGGQWGLTYDDGPSPYTAEVLDKLKAKNLKATFFVVASRVIEMPGTLLRTYNEGHQIAIHTWSHTALTTQSNEQIVAEVMWSALAIYSAIGIIPTYFRPPYGDIDDRVRAVIAAMGMKLVVWNFDSSDWSLPGASDLPQTTPEKVERSLTSFIGGLKPGSPGPVSLEHDLYKGSAEEGLKLMDMIIGSGLHPDSVAAGLGDTGGMFQTPEHRVNAMADGLKSVVLNINGSVVPPPSLSSTASASASASASATGSAVSKASQVSQTVSVQPSSATLSAAVGVISVIPKPPKTTSVASSGVASLFKYDSAIVSQISVLATLFIQAFIF